MKDSLIQAGWYALLILGFGLVVRAAWMWSHPAGYLAAGLPLAIAGFFGAQDPLRNMQGR